MTEQRFVAARGRSLQRSLAALGLVRVLAEQRDPGLRCRVVGDDLVIDTDVENIADWLVEEYRPRPVLSPWNGGSGFTEKDTNQRAKLETLLSYPDQDRVSALRRAVAVVDETVRRGRSEGWDKAALIREVANVCPDEMLPWLRSAVVVLGSGELAFPSLLGTGGNDGRLEFSSNYHQRLLDVFPADPKTERASRAWARDALAGTSHEKLVNASVGQFDPGSAGTPNTSAFGAAQSVVNPWLFVLMVEGATLFEAAPARRISAQSSVDKGAAMTFMTRGSSVGFSSGSADEDSRGEVWIPWWEHWLKWPAVTRIFAEGKATWRGKTATRSGDMYLAVGTRGVSAAVSEFDRYSIVKRNGLAFSAVRADTVRVTDDHLLRIVALVEDWPQRLPSQGGLPGTVSEHRRRFDDARVDLARTRSAREQIGNLRSMLQALTRLELAVGRSGALRESVPPRVVTSGSGWTLIDVLRDARLLDTLADTPEFRVALGLASVRLRWREGHWISIRDLLFPISGAGQTLRRWTDTSVVGGYGIRSLPDVMTDVLARVAIESAAAQDRPGGAGRCVAGVAMPTSVAVPLRDLHRYAAGELEDAVVAAWFDALVAFDWSGEQTHLRSMTANPLVPDTALALLGLLRNGLAANTGNDEPAQGLTVEILGALTARDVHRAVTLAQRRIGQTGRVPVSCVVPSDPRYLSTCLLPRASHQDLSACFVFAPNNVDARAEAGINDHTPETDDPEIDDPEIDDTEIDDTEKEAS
ncbi:type I-G CRISPR-associated protein Cas8g1/Csx17 [Gordonia paraffinivorans]|uniref:type I-G CRISPR-associated protein Cas8g1/Csx17 n=1 Tax=Gordonia paraffinivorans TaxID=175628 RepID=UPI0014461CF1|nr:type I-U CRISPR-associated protein Csx17 [Gordonia paraffinivorans]